MLEINFHAFSGETVFVCLSHPIISPSLLCLSASDQQQPTATQFKQQQPWQPNKRQHLTKQQQPWWSYQYSIRQPVPFSPSSPNHGRIEPDAVRTWAGQQPSGSVLHFVSI